jgi:hypothetical protein
MTSRSTEGSGHGFQSSESATLNTVVVVATPSARVSMAARVKPGSRRRPRRP